MGRRVFFKIVYWFAAVFFSLIPVFFQVTNRFSDVQALSFSTMHESHYGDVMAVAIVLLAVAFFSSLEVVRLTIRVDGIVALLMVPIVLILLALFAIFAMNYGSYLADGVTSPAFADKIEWYLFAASVGVCVIATVAEALAS